MRGRPARRLKRALHRLRDAVTVPHPVPDDCYAAMRGRFEIERSGDAARLVARDADLRLSVNASSIAILGLCNGGRRVGEVIETLATELGTPTNAVARDVRRLIGSLVESGAMELHAGPLPPSFMPPPVSTVVGGEVEAAVRFRMGRFFDRLLVVDDELAAVHGRGRMVLKFRGGRLEQPSGGDQELGGRDGMFLKRLTELDVPRRDFLVIFSGDDGGGRHESVPINAHFRVAGSDATILWPLRGYTEPGSSGFGADTDASDRPWKEKIEKAVWRGCTTGVVIEDMDEERIEELMSRPHSTRDPVSGRVLPKGNRLQLVARYSHDNDFDIGLASFAQVDEFAQSYFRKRGFFKSPLSMQELLQYKYQIVVDGNTFASQLPWTLHSRSVALMVPPAWETTVAGVTAWQHYVPLSPDFSDLKEKVEWCRSNDRRCMEISAAATELMRRYYDPEQERMVQQQMLDRYAENFSLY